MSLRRLLATVGLATVLVIALVAASEAATSFEEKKLTASDAQNGDSFGNEVAVDGDIAVVGAIFEGAGGFAAGAAYVFVRDLGGPGNWGEVKKLTASDAQAVDIFGTVAVSGDTAVVGAHQEDTGLTQAGAAYVFQRDEGGPDNWGEVKKLVASDAGPGNHLGISVAISGDIIYLGAYREDAGGDILDDFGAVYVYQRDEGGVDNWGEVKKLTASDAQRDDHFGWNVAASGDTLVVGARFEDAEGGGAGAAYVFERDEGGVDSWGEVKKLTASDAQSGDFFGWNVAVSGDTAAVGAYRESAGGENAGAAYVFRRDQGGADNWGEVAKLTASDAQAENRFGWSVAVSSDTAVVGAFLEDSQATNSGAAYVFRRDEGGPDNWGEVRKLLASDGRDFAKLGISVAISGATALVGADFQGAEGIRPGAAYVFDLLQTKPTPTQTATPTNTPTRTDTPPPTPVGGIAVEPDLSALGLDAAEASGVDAGAIALVVAAATAGAAMLGAVAVARKRRSRRSVRGG